MRIVVLGYIIRGPLGGLVWHHLQYVMGLARLGHDVYFLEDSDDYPACYDPSRDAMGTDPAYGLEFAARAFERVGLGERWAYHDAHAGAWKGPAAGHALGVCASADLLLNLSGVNPLRPWLEGVPSRALVDTDPVFTQIRHLTDRAARDAASRHTAFLSFGENIEAGRSSVPDDNFPWRATRQPVVLDAWPVTPGRADAPFTTVMQWDSYPAREYGGRRFAAKSESFGPYLDLPRRTTERLELAIGSPSAPRELLARARWGVRNPLDPTRDPWTYQCYIAGSKGEFTVAKHGYVESRSGWFSERSAAYLASGRPVLTQDTGFTDWLAADAGVVAFATPDDALAGLREIAGDYERHCLAAREVAAAYFDARAVLPRLLEVAYAPTRRPAPVGAGRDAPARATAAT
ncbi:MAG: hypothetical protein WKG32_19185 [Gemmatimonadaceae bacterium]